ncbi:DUF3883 domain-containing protein [Cereibacter johrii]|uniref:DUF3883 domain-containing protein n=1 Tax=Cereibacter johrii TaxID=445629 RepID=UPI002B261630|nr:DUF3883 domain-containing protein [Cereibacter johrii]MEA5162471.1 DUF3883 domain-containing protein [Cereibacter johrii]
MTSELELPGSDWNQREIDLAVSIYFEMWSMSLAGNKPNKSSYYRSFLEATGRSVKSIERKCQNISAVLERLGLPWLQGLAPLRHYQNALTAAVDAHVSKIWHSEDLIPESAPGLSDVLVLFPEQTPALEPPIITANPEMERLARKFDPALRDLKNRKIGLRGEEIVFHSERARLSAAGKPELAKMVKWVSQEEGDGAGYDIRSFETDGTERFYEVKSTIGHRRTPFFLSKNERDFAEEAPENFRIFRLYEIGRTPRSFLIAPPLDSALILEPSVYRASFG